MDKLWLTGQNLGRVFYSRSGCVRAMQLSCFETKRPSLKLKTRPKTTFKFSPIRYRIPRVCVYRCQTYLPKFVAKVRAYLTRSTY